MSLKAKMPFMCFDYSLYNLQIHKHLSRPMYKKHILEELFISKKLNQFPKVFF